MPIRNNAHQYGSVAMSLHWLIAVAIFANVVVAFYFNDLLSHRDPARGGLVNIHQSIGLTIMVLSLGRLFWRLVNPVPPLPREMPPGLRTLAHISHFLLYTMMIGVPLLGWLLASASRTGLAVQVFQLFTWPNIGFISNMSPPDKRHYGHLIGTTHEWLGYILLFLAVGHMCAALYHHYRLRDTVLQRMLP